MNLKEKTTTFSLAEKKYQLKLALSVGDITTAEYKKLLNSKKNNIKLCNKNKFNT
jgi:hypothetical protein